MEDAILSDLHIVGYYEDEFIREDKITIISVYSMC